MASYPTAPVVFPARTDGQTIFAQHINALQDEVAAIEASLLPGGTTNGLPTPLVVSGVRPTVLFDYTGGPAKGRMMMTVPANFGLLHNLTYDGTNFNADDVSQPSSFVQLAFGTLTFDSQPVGANPRAVSSKVQFGADGSIKERGRTTALGEWITIAFNAANFWAGVTAGMVPVNRYTLIGKTVIWQIQISGAPGPGATPYLLLTNPANLQMFATGGVLSGISYAADNAVPISPNAMAVTGNAGQVAIQKPNGANWTGPNVAIQATLTLALP